MKVSEGAKRVVQMNHGTGYIHEGVVEGRIAPQREREVVSYRRPNFAARLKRWWAEETTGAMVAELAGILGVSVASLVRLGPPAWSSHYQAWGWPMHDDRRRVIGIRLRNEKSKWAVGGSSSGCFIPSGIDSRSALLICEGPTDTAAAITLGYQAIGRPSCSGGTEIICDMLQAGRRRDVVIVADNDGPGQAGAKALQDRIVGLCASVRAWTPPAKDLREWKIHLDAASDSI
jgi:5S rRNA maturation endonuclease (ribonuclease M5)